MSLEREEAGELLAEALSNQNREFDVVLLTSLESFEIGREIASRLNLPLNTLISRGLEVPGGDQVFGAVSERDTIWIDDEKMRKTMIEEERVSKIKKDRLLEIKRSLNETGLEFKPELDSKNVLLVSEAIKSGLSEACSLGAALRAGADNRIMVSPSISEVGLEKMSLADEVICLERSSYSVNSNELLSRQKKINQDKIKDYFRA